MKRGWSWLLGLLVIVFLFFIPSLLTIYTEFQWFTRIGYRGVFLTNLTYKVLSGGLAFLLTGALLSAVYYWLRYTVSLDAYEQKFTKAGIFGVAAVLGFGFVGTWQTLLRYVNRVVFNVTDPVFGKDIAFYVFALPFYELIAWLFLVVLGIAIVGVLVVYARRFGFEEHDEVISTTGERIATKQFNFNKFVRQVRENGASLVSALFGIFFIAYGVYTWLGRYALLNNAFGTVYGIGYAQSHIQLPLITVTAGIAILGGIATIINGYLQKKHVIPTVVAALVIVSIVSGVATTVVQNYVVEPDEFNKERTFIQHEINYTNQAFDLDTVREESFSVAMNQTKAALRGHQSTLNNIRLWDSRPLLRTYNELQIFRSYYTFTDVDVDRYQINGKEKAVMLASREIEYDNLPTRSWVNEHLVYTHGHGVAMSPVRNVTSQGLPKFYIKDIPPQSNEFNITQPGIYYGENQNTYTIVNTQTKEFDYPRGNKNVYTTYNGTGGVPINSLMDRLAHAVRFQASQILFSGSIDKGSKIQFHKNIKERVRQVAPFLKLDNDPYMVTYNGSLYWMIDAYTTAQRYPYSRPHMFKGNAVNYARNSVKIVVDAYDGSMQFYIAEREPVINTYANAYDSLFKPLKVMPDGLQRHIRYPEDLFQLQGRVYAKYHMHDPQVFYNKEDVWRVPSEVLRGQRKPMEPYYIIMELPGAQEAEFVQIMPYVPRGKENMIGWLAARSDGTHYGEIVAYKLSKQNLVFGPMQVEARISQDAQISKQITLWSQSGSSVFRGNLLAIPLDDTFLYVEPLFLQSTGSGSLPELKRVIVAHQDELAMEPTLQEALQVVFGNRTETRVKAGNVTRSVTPAQSRQLQRAQRLYRQAQQALKQGNLSLFDKRINALGNALRE